MRKVPKSLQAIIITMLFGMFIPKVFEITGVSLFDKMMIKGILSLAFSAATICVGALFSTHILRDRVAGGKSRIFLYIVFTIIFLSCISTVISFIQSVSHIIFYVLTGITAVLILILIVWLLIKTISAKKDFKITQEKSVIHSQKKNETDSNRIQQNSLPAAHYIPRSLSVLSSNKNIKLHESDRKLKTLYELWFEKDEKQKCLMATNDENPDLKWIKIYKPPYANGKFYGYILMNNARNTVSGEIYFADRKIWRVVD